MKKVIRNSVKAIAALMAVMMIAAFMPGMNEGSYAASKKPAKVKGLKVTVSEKNKVTVTWKKAKNAKKYEVSIKDGSSKLTSTKKSKKCKITFQGGNAVKYTVKVRGIKGKKNGKWAKAVNVTTNDLNKAAQDAAAAKAEADKKAAEDALAKAEADKKAAEDALAKAEADKKAAEDALAKAEADKKAAEDALAKAEADKKAAEDEKAKAAEDAKAAAEKAAQEKIDAAEADKKAAEEALADANKELDKAKEDLKAAEAALKEAEEAKTAAEQRAIAAEAELEKLKKEKADKEAADAVVGAWADVPEITVDSSEDDIAAANAVISEYDELTDDQKALVPDDVKAEIEAAKAVIAEIEEEAAKIAAVKQAIKDAEVGGTVTIDEKEFIVVSKESDTAELILKNGIENVPFDTEGGYDWASSSLRTYLNSSEGWLAANPTVSALAEETSYSYSIGEYDMNEDDFVYKSKTSTDRVYIPAFDTGNSKAKLPEDIVTKLTDGCAFWTSCGYHASFYDEGELVEMQGAVSCGSTTNNWEEDSSATTSYGDPIKVNPMFTVALD